MVTRGRRGPSPAGGSQAGEGGEEPGQGDPRRLNFRSAQFMHGGAGDVVTTNLVKMLSLSLSLSLRPNPTPGRSPSTDQIST
jgi:hypothetical protein